jgi:hypothetical protein
LFAVVRVGWCSIGVNKHILYCLARSSFNLPKGLRYDIRAGFTVCSRSPGQREFHALWVCRLLREEPGIAAGKPEPRASGRYLVQEQISR